MRFRRKVHDMRDPVIPDHLLYRRLVAEVHLLKPVLGMPADSLQIFGMPRIGETVHVYQRSDLRTVDDMLDQIGTNKAGPAGDE